MSPSAQLTSEQMNLIFENEKNTVIGASKVQEQVEDGEEVLNPENTSSVLNMVLSTINNEFKHEFLDQVVRHWNPYPISQSTDDRLPGHKHSFPGLPETIILVQLMWATCFIVRRWVLDADMQRKLVEDEMGLGKTFTSVTATMNCKLVTEKVVMGLPLSMSWGNNLEEWEILPNNEFSGVTGVLNSNNQYTIYWTKYSRLSKISFYPRLILRLNLLHRNARARPIEPSPKSVSFV